MKTNWYPAESRYNDTIDAYEIISLKEKKIAKYPWENGEDYFIIKGSPNDFTIKFFLHRHGHFVSKPYIGAPLMSATIPLLKQNNRFEFLRKIEEIVFTFANTAVNLSKNKSDDN